MREDGESPTLDCESSIHLEFTDGDETTEGFLKTPEWYDELELEDAGVKIDIQRTDCNDAETLRTEFKVNIYVPESMSIPNQ